VGRGGGRSGAGRGRGRGRGSKLGLVSPEAGRARQSNRQRKQRQVGHPVWTMWRCCGVVCQAILDAAAREVLLPGCPNFPQFDDDMWDGDELISGELNNWCAEALWWCRTWLVSSAAASHCAETC
jgi:hypothetical protein